MGDKSGIEWTDATWTPVRARNKGGQLGWHCEHKSEACRNCYAEAFNLRLGTRLPFKPGHLKNGDVVLFLDNALLMQPMRWQRPRKIFPFSMSDLFGEFMDVEWIAHVFAVMALCDWHEFQLVTKRPGRAKALINDPAFVDRIEKCMDKLAPDHWCKRELDNVGGWPLKNVGLGTSAGDQPEAEANVVLLLETKAAWRFVSYEPAHGRVDLTALAVPYTEIGVFFDALTGSNWKFIGGQRYYIGGPIAENGKSLKLDWVIAGGESGVKARPSHPDWFRSVRDQCAAAGVPFFFKQWGEWLPIRQLQQRHAEILGGKRLAVRVLDGDGTVRPGGGADCTDPANAYGLLRAGKKVAGAVLDGVEHKAWPR